MSRFFLKIKDWQFFLLIFVLPIGTSFIVGGYMFFDLMNDMDSAHASNFEENELFDFLFDKMRTIVNIITPIYLISALSFVWYWTLGNKLQQYIPEELRKDTTWFNILILFTAFIYVIPNIAGMYFLENMDISMLDNDQLFEDKILTFNVIYYTSLFINLLMSIYTMYFCTKIYKTALLQREVTFGDHVGEFFAAYFLFVGIWVMQPKINKLENGTLNIEGDRISDHLIE